MTDAKFAQTDPEWLSVLEELRAREPIFHTAAFGRTRAEWEHAMMPEYWEVGASGRRYSRAFILDWLERNPPVEAAEAGWRTWDFAVRRLGGEAYLLTYTLNQAGRLTRRATLWLRDANEWRIAYHQGTVVEAEVDDQMPGA
ncbi:MAG TPA: hypothetical protein VND90_05025 [Terracidiphilus sp.]|nr:hypothetical protein [Terracidiphilus sp.]